jgi:hypothetical protein
MTAELQGKLKRGRASLIGGIAVGIGVFGLWLLIERNLGYDGAAATGAGLVVAIVIGAWVRVADL